MEPIDIIAFLLDPLGLFRGGQKAPIFGPDYTASMYNPWKKGDIPGITLGYLDVPGEYARSWTEIKTSMRVTNETDRPRVVKIQAYQMFYRANYVEEGHVRGYWDRGMIIPVGVPKVVTLAPNGQKKVEIWMHTPPIPRPADIPQYEDILRTEVQYHVTDEFGNTAVVTKIMRATGTPTPWG